MNAFLRFCPFLMLVWQSLAADNASSLPRKAIAELNKGMIERTKHHQVNDRNLVENTGWVEKVTLDIEAYFRKNCPCEVFKKFNTHTDDSVQKLDIQEMIALFTDIAQTQNEPGSSLDWSQGGNAAFWANQWTKDKFCTEEDIRCAKCVEDPRFHRFTGNIFYFHGLCDLVLFQNEKYNSGAGLSVHICTDHKISPATGETAAFITQAAVKVGYDILEVHSDGSYYLNGAENVNVPSPMSGGTYKVEKHEYKVCFGPNKDKRCTQEILFDVSVASSSAVEKVNSLSPDVESNEDLPDLCRPNPNDDIFCPQVFEPVICYVQVGDIEVNPCRFGNQCEAGAAGFSPEDCQQDNNNQSTCNLGVETDWLGVCPKPNGICTLELNPVTCALVDPNSDEPVLCDYSNPCFANSAGFDAMSCGGKCDLEKFDMITSNSKNDHIYIKVHHDMIHVELNLVPDSVASGIGLLSDTNKRLARDGVTVLKDPNEFAKEWQVNPVEDGGSLFRNSTAPQYPDQCIMPPIHETQNGRKLRKVGEI